MFSAFPLMNVDGEEAIGEEAEDEGSDDIDEAEKCNVADETLDAAMR